MKHLLLLATWLLILASFYTTDVHATHLQGGYITAMRDTTENPNPRRIFFTLITFTKEDSDVHDPQVIINMGDGNTVTVPWTCFSYDGSRCGQSIGNGISKMKYQWEYTFPAEGTYTASWNGINRNNNIFNIASPSQDVSMRIATTININSLRGFNSTPNFIALAPIYAKAGKRLEYNFLAHDVDGDSVAYKLRIPTRVDAQGAIRDVPGYTLPHQTFNCSGNATNHPNAFTLDTINGQLIWDTPCRTGEYAVAVAVEEWWVREYDGRRTVVKLSEINYDVIVTVFDDPADGLEILETDELSLSKEGYVAAKPGEEFTLKISYGSLTPDRSPAHGNIISPYEKLASDLSKVADANVKYSIEQTAAGPVGTFTFTPTEAMARVKPYFIQVYGKAGNAYTIAKSIGIQIGDFPLRIGILNIGQLSLTEEGHAVITPNSTLKLTTFVEYAARYDLSLEVQSALKDNAKLFSFTTRDSANSVVGELLFKPHELQVSDAPQKITFRLNAEPARKAGERTAANSSETITEEIEVLVAVKSAGPLSAKDELEQLEINLFPNPVKEKLSLKSDSKAILYLYTVNGKLVWEQPVSPGQNEFKRPSNISVGMYLYKILGTGGHKKSGKLVLQ